MKSNSNDHLESSQRSAHQKVDATASGVHDAVDWAANAANNAADNLNERGNELKATQEKWLASARAYIQDNPTTSVGIALAGGYLLSRILRSS
jgi:ElaB/YqjD/DUF883 family membrane-anchored ribosome-binding protein